MSFYDDASLIVYPSGYKESKIYAQKPVPSYGAEQITNGDFATDTDWTKETGWTISGGNANYNGNAVLSAFYQNAVTSGVKYRVSFDVLNYVSGSFKVHLSDGQAAGSSPLITDNGNYVFDTTSVGALVLFRNVTSFIGSIDNVSVKEVLNDGDLTFTRASSATRVNSEGLIEEASVISPTELVTNGNFATDSDWTKETGWSIVGGNLIATSVSGTAAYQVGSGLVSGKKYQVQFEITEYTTGAIGLRAGTGATLQTFNSIGVHYADMVASGALQIRFDVSGTTTLKVDNVSVKEVITSNIPRIDYSNGCGSLLLEKQSTNLFTESENFSNGDWTLYGGATITANNAVSPQGVQNATKLTDTGGIYNQVVYNPNINYVFSLFAKTDTATSITMNFVDQGVGYLGGSIKYTFATGATSIILQSANGSVTADKEDYGNGWIRVILKFTTNVAQNYNYQQIDFQGGDGWIFGAQLEQSSYPTSYIPTSGTTTTRIADAASKTGLSSVINSPEGVLYLEVAALADDGTTRQLSLSDGSSANNKLSIIYTSTTNQIQAFVRASGSISFNETFTLSSATSSNKIAIKWKLNDFALWVNGVEVDTDISGNAPIGLSKLSFDDADGASNFYGKCQNLMVFPSALTDDELADLTGAVHQTFNSLATFYNYTIL